MKRLWNAITTAHNFYIKNTSVHGFIYVSSKVPLSHRAMWILIIMSSFGGSCLIALALWERFMGNPTRMTIPSQHLPSSKVEFPGVTFCSANCMKKDNIKKFIASLNDRPNNMSQEDIEISVLQMHILTNPTVYANVEKVAKLQEVIKANRYSLLQAMNLLPQSCTDFIEKCSWEGKIVNCSAIFRNSNSIYGPCCSFNFRPYFRRRVGPLFTNYYGVHMGLTVLFNVKSHTAAILDRAGATIVVFHKSTEYPAVLGNFNLASPGHESYFAIEGIVNYCSEDVAGLPLESRECLFPHERRLSNFFEYEEGNCDIECFMNASLQLCGCLPYFYPRPHAQKECQVEDAICLITKLVKFLRESSQSQYSCQCFKLCSTTQYKIHSDYNKLNAVKYSMNSFLTGVNLTKDHSIVHVYLKSQVSLIHRQDVVTSWRNLISSLGGVFNLFLGCSIVTTFEFIYIWLIRFINYFRSLKSAPKEETEAKVRSSIEYPNNIKFGKSKKRENVHGFMPFAN